MQGIEKLLTPTKCGATLYAIQCKAGTETQVNDRVSARVHGHSQRITMACRKRCLASSSCSELIIDELFQGLWQTCS